MINGYNNIDRTGILHGKVFLTCVAILGPQIETLNMINRSLRTTNSENRFDPVIAKAHN